MARTESFRVFVGSTEGRPKPLGVGVKPFRVGCANGFARDRAMPACYFGPVSDNQSLTSTLLVAMPQLDDPNFRRTVMLIVEHDQNGTFGLVLNRTVDLLASTLCASLDVIWRGDPRAKMQWGGPVEPNTGWLLINEPVNLNLDDPAISRIGEHELYLARSVEVLKNASSEAPGAIRFYLGYAGWGPGQLEAEMAQGAWLVAPHSRKTIFESAEDAVWDEAVRSLDIEPASLISTQGVH